MIKAEEGANWERQLTVTPTSSKMKAPCMKNRSLAYLRSEGRMRSAQTDVVQDPVQAAGPSAFIPPGFDRHH